MVMQDKTRIETQLPHNVQEAQKLQDRNKLKHQAYAIMCLEYYVLEACTVRHSIARGFALA